MYSYKWDAVIGRRQFSKALAASLSVAASLAQAKDTALPVPASLPQAAQAAQAKGQLLVLLISLPGCVYCELVRRSYLLPLLPESGLQAWQLPRDAFLRVVTASIASSERGDADTRDPSSQSQRGREIQRRLAAAAPNVHCEAA